MLTRLRPSLGLCSRIRLARCIGSVDPSKQPTLNYFQNKQQQPEPMDPRLSHYYKDPRKRNNRRNAWILGGLLTGSVYLAWALFWPHHTFPSSVAKILRKALWAESDKENQDYAKAAGLYLEALEELEQLDIDKCSDEYTGVELKLMEMYQKQNDTVRCVAVLQQIADRYFDRIWSFLSNDAYVLGAREKATETIKHYMEKDLRVVFLLSELLRPDLAIDVLLKHLILTEKLVTKHPPLFDVMKDQIEREMEWSTRPFHTYQPDSTPRAYTEKPQVGMSKPGKIVYTGKNDDEYLFIEPWIPFRDTYFMCRLQYERLCILTNDYDTYFTSATKTIEWMALADIADTQILIAQLNLAAGLFTWSLILQQKSESAENTEEVARLAQYQQRVSEDLVRSILGYTGLPEIIEAEANLQLGNIELSRGNLDDAERYLRHAKVKAVRNQMESTLHHVALALDNLTLERESSEKPEGKSE